MSPWIYLAVAALIAVAAFAIGQLAPGLGVGFVVLASTMWAAISVRRQRQANHR